MNSTRNAFVLELLLDAIASAAERWIGPRLLAVGSFVLGTGGGKRGFGAFARVDTGRLGAHVEGTGLVVKVSLEDSR